MGFENLLGQQLPELLREYITAPCFGPSESGYPSNAWRHPLGNDGVTISELLRPITAAEQTTARHLAVQRLLLAIYEQDLCYMGPKLNDPVQRQDYSSYYAPKLSALGKAIRPWVEEAAFGFLEGEVDARPDMSPEALIRHMNEVIDACDTTPVGQARFIASSLDPGLAARCLIIQIAVDALNEASALGRTLLGVFGSEQCALMRIFMDEYGLGKLPDKHGTLFEELMTSSGLSKETPHYYYAYLPTSIAMTNYFHYLCCTRAHLFRYLGALFYLEATMPHFSDELTPVLRQAIGPTVITRYLDEHAHIDPVHKQIAFGDLVASSLEKYGSRIVPELYHGFEAIRIIQNAADDDYRHQVEFALALRQPRSTVEVSGPLMRGSRLGRIEAVDSLLQLVEGPATIDAVGFAPETLKVGEVVLLPAGRLYTLNGNACAYRLAPSRITS